ncbi:MAG TPA: ABC transporter ATP-binding protein [Chthoniobacteraceae bacterium]|nr:ABC transporter ATP-binding protein [Chthoniobacteraceae bacterium]
MTQPDAQPEIKIAVRDLYKQIGEQKILCGVNLEVIKGETLVVLGRSGCGKSVLLKHLIGLMTPTSGEVSIAGQEIVGLNERELLAIRKRIGMMFQSGALFDSMTVWENVAFPLREGGERDTAVIAKKVAEALEVVNLTGHEEKKPENISGGMKKRVALARGIINSPSCVLYDEPTAGLDPVVSDSIDHLIRRLQKRLGVTSIVVTHDMKSAAFIADKVAYLYQGEVYFYGTFPELVASEDPLISDFVHGRSHEVV